MVSQEQHEIEHVARDLLFRDGNDVLETSLANGELAAATKHRLAALQGKIKVTDVGQGSRAFVISKLDLKALGFGMRAWEHASTIHLVQSLTYNGVPSYSIDKTLLTQEIEGRLTAVTGKSLQEAQARYAALSTNESPAR